MGLGLSNALFPMHFGQKFVENGQFEIFSNFHFLKKFQILLQNHPNLAKFGDIQIGGYGRILLQNTSEMVRLKSLNEFFPKTTSVFP